MVSHTIVPPVRSDTKWLLTGPCGVREALSVVKFGLNCGGVL